MNPLRAKQKTVELESHLERLGVRARIRATESGLIVSVNHFADKLIAKSELTARGCQIAAIELP